MFISNDYLLEEGKEIPDGTLVRKCRICNKSYSIPIELTEKFSDVCDDEKCKSIYNKEVIDAIHSLMQSNKIIEKALGS